MKKRFFKRNWDIVSAYLITGLSILITFILIQGCHDFGCLGLLMTAIIGIFISEIISVVGIIRTFRNRMSKWRIIWFLPFIFTAIYFAFYWFNLFDVRQ